MCLLHLGTHNLLGERKLIEMRLSLNLVHLRLDLGPESLIDVILIVSSLASFAARRIGSCACLVLLFQEPVDRTRSCSIHGWVLGVFRRRKLGACATTFYFLECQILICGAFTSTGQHLERLFGRQR